MKKRIIRIHSRSNKLYPVLNFKESDYFSVPIVLLRGELCVLTKYFDIQLLSNIYSKRQLLGLYAIKHNRDYDTSYIINSYTKMVGAAGLNYACVIDKNKILLAMGNLNINQGILINAGF